MRINHRLVSRLASDERGVAFFEFALVLPTLILMFYGMVELSRYAQFKDRLESGSMQMLDIIGQNENVRVTSLQDLFRAFPILMAPFPTRLNPPIMVTYISTPPLSVGNCKPVVVWRYGPGSNKLSRLGKVGEAATLPSSLSGLAPGDHLIAIEVMEKFQPLLSNSYTRDFLANLTGDTYRASYARARLGAYKRDPWGRRVIVPCIPKS